MRSKSAKSSPIGSLVQVSGSGRINYSRPVTFFWNPRFELMAFDLITASSSRSLGVTGTRVTGLSSRCPLPGLNRPLGSPCKPVVAGEELFIVGYPATSRESKVQVENLTKTVVRFTVIREPYWTDQSDSTLLYLDGAQSGTYFGLSGAPAVRWNAVDQQLELVGLYLGTIECELFGWRQSAHVVRLAHGMKSLSPLSSVH